MNGIDKMCACLVVAAGLHAMSPVIHAAPVAEAPATVAKPKVPAALFITDLSARTTAKLGEKPDAREMRRWFKEVLEQTFDMPFISNFVLGPYLSLATPQEREEFQKLLVDYAVNFYATNFEEFKGKTISVKWSNPINDTETLVHSELLDEFGTRVTTVDWYVRENGKGSGNFIITDLKAAGISQMLTHRQELGGLIQRAGGKHEGLLVMFRQLREHLGIPSPAGS